MKELFLYLCGFSVVTSIAVIVAVILRPVLKKGPSYIRCILWALVFLRLLIPVGFVGIPFSIPDPFAAAPETVSTPQNEERPAENHIADNSIAQSPAQNPTQNPTQSPAQNPAQNPAQSPAQTPGQTPANDEIPANSDIAAAPVTEQIEPQGENGIDVLSVISVVWVCGVIVLLCYMVASSLLLRYRVRNAIVYDSRIRIIDKDCSPFVSGIFRPMIYIPASVDKKDWSYIIAHETSHIKRLDHVLKPLAFLVLCFYWFNPLIWVAYLLLNKDIEYACDERTVKYMENQERQAYSLALLSVSRGANIVPAMPLSFGKVSVKERIKRVMNRKIPVWAICLTVIVCASLSIVIACTPDTKKSTDAESDAESIDSSSADAEVSENSVESGIALEITVDYADLAELSDDTLFFSEQFDTSELVKIQVNKEVKNFKLITVFYDEDLNPYAGNTLYGVSSLTPDRPFYANVRINELVSDRGISFVDDGGETVYYRISYDSYGNASASLLLDAIQSEPPKQSEKPAVPKPIDNTGVPEEFWNCENIAADIESFQSIDPYNEDTVALYTYIFLGAYLNGDADLAWVGVSDDCLSRFPSKVSAYGAIDDMEHFYFENIRYAYSTDEKTARAWGKAVFAIKGQFYDLTLSFDAEQLTSEYGFDYYKWMIVDFEIAEKEIDPADLKKDVVELQDISFRFFKAFLTGDIEAAKTMVDAPNDPEHPALMHFDRTRKDSLLETEYSVGISGYQYDEKSGVERISVCIPYADRSFDGETPIKAFLGICMVSEEVKDDAGNVIDRVWKITDCGVEV